MKRITTIRKAVCVIANELKKAGYSLSQAFKRAWKLVKCPIKVRAAGTTFENRQERLRFLRQFRLEELTVTLEREPDNEYDGNAIQIVIHILPISRKTVIGYVPKGLAKELAKVIDIGVQISVTLRQIIGGYSYKESLGALLEIAI